MMYDREEKKVIEKAIEIDERFKFHHHHHQPALHFPFSMYLSLCVYV